MHERRETERVAHGTLGSHGTEPTKRELFWPLRRLSLLAAMGRLAAKMRRTRRRTCLSVNSVSSDCGLFPSALPFALRVPEFLISRFAPCFVTSVCSFSVAWAVRYHE